MNRRSVCRAVLLYATTTVPRTIVLTIRHDDGVAIRGACAPRRMPRRPKPRPEGQRAESWRPPRARPRWVHPWLAPPLRRAWPPPQPQAYASYADARGPRLSSHKLLLVPRMRSLVEYRIWDFRTACGDSYRV